MPHRIGTLGPHLLEGRNVALIQHALEVLEERIVVLVHKTGKPRAVSNQFNATKTHAAHPVVL